MVTGYGGTYRGAVVDDADPLQQNRLGVVVPDVYGDGLSAWALPLQSAATLPAVGDVVLISFERGDSDYPIWEPYSEPERTDEGAGGYAGKYRAAVLDNVDPMQENRLQVTVPEIDNSPVWATAGEDVRYGLIPEIGWDVWIEYEYGDPAYPRWVGVA